MKKNIKHLISYLLTAVIIISATISVSMTVSAAVATIKSDKTSYTVGEKVKITVNITADENMTAVDAYVKYNKSVLKFENQTPVVSQGDNIYMTSNVLGTTTQQFAFEFTAIAAGSSEIELFDVAYVDDSKDQNAQMKPISGDKKTITVTTPSTTPDPTPTPTPDPTPDTPSETSKSSNANLGSLSVSGGTLEPEFSAATTSYTATVRFEVAKATISANAQDGKSAVEGLGTFDLEEGNNKKYITVTAEDGTKKTYEVNIKRLTAEETAALGSESTDVELGPLDVELNGSLLRVVQDTSNLAVPHGFTAATAMHNDLEVGVMMDSVKGEYILYYLTDLSGYNGDYYYKDEEGNFHRLNYISVNGRLYIVEEPFGNYTAPDGWEDCTYNLHTGKVKAFSADNASMEGFYMFYCYVDGERGFYRYDSIQNTIQRDPGFELYPLSNEEAEGTTAGFFGRFAAMNFAGKAVVVLLILAVIFIIAIVVLMIMKFVKGNNEPEISEEEPAEMPEDQFLPIDDGNENFTMGEAQELPDDPNEF